jgi:hypothetical protein
VEFDLPTEICYSIAIVVILAILYKVTTYKHQASPRQLSQVRCELLLYFLQLGFNLTVVLRLRLETYLETVSRRFG